MTRCLAITSRHSAGSNIGTVTVEPPSQVEPGERRDAGHMEHRRRTEEHVVGLERAGQDLVEGVGDQVAVSQHHPLRHARRTPGVEQRGEIVWPHTMPESTPCGAVDVVEQPFVVVGHRDDVLDECCQVTGVAVGDQDSGATVLHDVGQLGRRQPGVERHQHDACRRKPEERLEISMPVRRQQGDPIAMLHSQPGERAGQAVAAIGELRVAERALAVDHGESLAEAGSGVFEGVGQRQHQATTLWPCARHDGLEHIERSRRSGHAERSSVKSSGSCGSETSQSHNDDNC